MARRSEGLVNALDILCDEPADMHRFILAALSLAAEQFALYLGDWLDGFVFGGGTAHRIP